MLISRRKFVKISAVSATGIAFSNLIAPNILKANSTSKHIARLPIIWFQAQTCSGCSVSLVNTEYPSIDEVLIEVISLAYNPTIMGATGDKALEVIESMMSDHKNEYLLVVEGSIPLESKGDYCTVGEKFGIPVTALDWVKNLGKEAKAVIAVGSCSSWGGIPAAPPNPTKAVSLTEIVDHDLLINIPGCPPHPDWITGTLVHVLKYGIPKLDNLNRPVMYFGKDKVIHDNCELRKYFDRSKFAKYIGDSGCLYELGCKGPIAHCDVSIRGWNSGVNWCNRSGGPCIGCTEPSFPGLVKSGLYERLPAAEVPGFAGINTTANTVGKILGIATVAGVVTHAVARSINLGVVRNKRVFSSDDHIQTEKLKEDE